MHIEKKDSKGRQMKNEVKEIQRERRRNEERGSREVERKTKENLRKKDKADIAGNLKWEREKEIY